METLVFENLNEKKIYKYLQGFPTLEAAVVELCHVQKLGQTKIAELFGVSQPTVHYWSQRAQKRLEVFKYFLDLSDPEIHEYLKPYVQDDQTRKILTLYCRTSSFLYVARKFGIDQGGVRSKILCALKLLEKGNSEFHTPFKRLFENHGIHTPENAFDVEVPKAVLQKLQNRPLTREHTNGTR